MGIGSSGGIVGFSGSLAGAPDGGPNDARRGVGCKLMEPLAGVGGTTDGSRAKDISLNWGVPSSGPDGRLPNGVDC